MLKLRFRQPENKKNRVIARLEQSSSRGNPVKKSLDFFINAAGVVLFLIQ